LVYFSRVARPVILDLKAQERVDGFDRLGILRRDAPARRDG